MQKSPLTILTISKLFCEYTYYYSKLPCLRNTVVIIKMEKIIWITSLVLFVLAKIFYPNVLQYH